MWKHLRFIHSSWWSPTTPLPPSKNPKLEDFLRGSAVNCDWFIPFPASDHQNTRTFIHIYQQNAKKPQNLQLIPVQRWQKPGEKLQTLKTTKKNSQHKTGKTTNYSKNDKLQHKTTNSENSNTKLEKLQTSTKTTNSNKKLQNPTQNCKIQHKTEKNYILQQKTTNCK